MQKNICNISMVLKYHRRVIRNKNTSKKIPQGIIMGKKVMMHAYRASQVALIVKESIWEFRETWGWSLGWDWQPTPVVLPGKFHGQRSLAGYSPWGHKKLDTTEQLSTGTHINDFQSEDLICETYLYHHWNSVGIPVKSKYISGLPWWFNG